MAEPSDRGLEGATCFVAMALNSHLKHKQTKRHVRLFVNCVCQERPSYVWTNAILHIHLRVYGWIKIRDKAINTRNLVSWLSGKSFCHQMSHFKAKIHHIRFSASVRLCLRWSLTLTTMTMATVETVIGILKLHFFYFPFSCYVLKYYIICFCNTPS